jgi:DNA modification methylase
MKTWPADKVIRRSIDGLEPYPKNARIHSATQIAQIAKSIQEYGFTIPVLTDEQGRIIAGHGRVEAAKTLGLTEVPTMTAEAWSEAQRRAYTILDNKIALNASWDDAILGAEFAELEVLGFDLGNLGFDPPELALIRDSLAHGLIDPDAPAPIPPLEPVATTGDLWALGRHRLLCGDATKADDVKNVLDGAKPHLMVTDPPYGVDYEGGSVNINKRKKLDGDQSSDLFAPALNLTKQYMPDGAWYIWHADRTAEPVYKAIRNAGYDIRALIIWHKLKAHYGAPAAHYCQKHEPLLYAVRGNAKFIGPSNECTVWEIEQPTRNELHPTQKPVECMMRPIRNHEGPGQIVYEPFSGSGTTIIAAEMTARKCYAIEINPAYVDVAIIRWQNFTGKDATLGDETFAQVAGKRKSKAA